MKEYIKDFCVCIIASILIIEFSRVMESNFFDKLMESLMEVICGIFAINIASTALIADLINKIQNQTGHKFEKSKQTLIRELKIQAGMIFTTLILSIFYYSDFSQISFEFITNLENQILLTSKIGILSIFMFFMDYI